MVATHKLEKRQDLLSLLLAPLLGSSGDQVIYDIPVDSEQPIVFGITPYKSHKSLYAQNTDLTNLASKITNHSLDAHMYTVFGENQETVDYLLDSTLIN